MIDKTSDVTHRWASSIPARAWNVAQTNNTSPTITSVFQFTFIQNLMPSFFTIPLLSDKDATMPKTLGLQGWPLALAGCSAWTCMFTAAQHFLLQRAAISPTTIVPVPWHIRSNEQPTEAQTSSAQLPSSIGSALTVNSINTVGSALLKDRELRRIIRDA